MIKPTFIKRDNAKLLEGYYLLGTASLLNEFVILSKLISVKLVQADTQGCISAGDITMKIVTAKYKGSRWLRQ